MKEKWILGLAFILGLIVFFLVPLFMGKHSNCTYHLREISQIQELQKILVMYYFEHNAWPISLENLAVNNQCSNEVNILRTDCWGRALIFQPFDPAKGYGAVISYGRDGQPGGTGEDADLEVRFGP